MCGRRQAGRDGNLSWEGKVGVREGRLPVIGEPMSGGLLSYQESSRAAWTSPPLW